MSRCAPTSPGLWSGEADAPGASAVTSAGDARAHTLARHRDILQEFTQARSPGARGRALAAQRPADRAPLARQEFRRVRNNLVASREHAALLGACAASRPRGSPRARRPLSQERAADRFAWRSRRPVGRRRAAGWVRRALCLVASAPRRLSARPRAQGASAGRHDGPAAARARLHPQLRGAARRRHRPGAGGASHALNARNSRTGV